MKEESYTTDKKSTDGHLLIFDSLPVGKPFFQRKLGAIPTKTSSSAGPPHNQTDRCIVNQ